LTFTLSFTPRTESRLPTRSSAVVERRAARWGTFHRFARSLHSRASCFEQRVRDSPRIAHPFRRTRSALAGLCALAVLLAATACLPPGSSSPATPSGSTPQSITATLASKADNTYGVTLTSAGVISLTVSNLMPTPDGLLQVGIYAQAPQGSGVPWVDDQPGTDKVFLASPSFLASNPTCQQCVSTNTLPQTIKRTISSSGGTFGAGIYNNGTQAVTYTIAITIASQ
jgi:hypothetical protein